MNICEMAYRHIIIVLHSMGYRIDHGIVDVRGVQLDVDEIVERVMPPPEPNEFLLILEAAQRRSAPPS